DHRCDLFSLGSVLYAACTGMPPFSGPTAVAVLWQVCDETPGPIHVLNPVVPARLETPISGLMAKDPAHRVQGAAEVATLLEGYLAHLQQPDRVPAPRLPGTPAGGWPGRRSSWLAAVLLLATLGLSAFLLAQATLPDGKSEEGRHGQSQEGRLN